MFLLENESDLPVVTVPAGVWLPAEGERADDWSKRWHEYWKTVELPEECIVLAPNGVEVFKGSKPGCILWEIRRAVGVRSNWFRTNFPEAHSSNRTPRFVDVGGV